MATPDSSPRLKIVGRTEQQNWEEARGLGHDGRSRPMILPLRQGSVVTSMASQCDGPFHRPFHKSLASSHPLMFPSA